MTDDETRNDLPDRTSGTPAGGPPAAEPDEELAARDGEAREDGNDSGNAADGDSGTGDAGDGDSADAAASPLSSIGSALRRLRMHRGLRQYEAAEAAGITKAMLSAYETGKRRPSLKTLDSLLGAMDAHLGDLHRAMVEERRGYATPAAGGREVRETPSAAWGTVGAYGHPSLYDLLGLDAPLPPEEERALQEMLHGFLKLLRFMHHSLEPAGSTGGARSRYRRAVAGRGPYDGD